MNLAVGELGPSSEGARGLQGLLGRSRVSSSSLPIQNHAPSRLVAQNQIHRGDLEGGRLSEMPARSCLSPAPPNASHRTGLVCGVHLETQSDMGLIPPSQRARWLAARWVSTALPSSRDENVALWLRHWLLGSQHEVQGRTLKRPAERLPSGQHECLESHSCTRGLTPHGFPEGIYSVSRKFSAS